MTHVSSPETTVTTILLDAFDRIADGVDELVGEMPAVLLNARPSDAGNPVGWLVWHLTRIQDHQVAEIGGRRQAWDEGGWRDRFALPLEPADTGYGHDAAKVAATHIVDGQLLIGYQRAVHEMSRAIVSGLPPGRLDEIIDERFEPPVTVAVRLVSVIEDCFQHVGQAAYVAGLISDR